MFEFVTKYYEETKTFYISHATQAEIDTIEYPKGVEDITVMGDYIQSFRIPEGVRSASIAKCALRELYVPDSMEFLYIDNNFLTHLEVPHTIQVLRASNNMLRSITFRGNKNPTELVCFYVKNNRIEKFDFIPPESLTYIDLRNNVGMTYICPPLQKVWYSIDEDAIDN